eukprot:scaffold2965_cov39-Phaeocystis_antarctica.AAC.1
MNLQTLSPPAAPPPAVVVPPKPRRRAPELRYLPLELLTAAASHRTGVEDYLDHHEQQLAEVMKDGITGEEAIELAIYIDIYCERLDQRGSKYKTTKPSTFSSPTSQLARRRTV